MLFDPTERNVDPFLFPTGIRTMKKLVLTSAIHDKNVTMAEAAQVSPSSIPGKGSGSRR